MNNCIKHRKRIKTTLRAVALYEDEQSFDRFMKLAKSVIVGECTDLVRKHKTRKTKEDDCGNTLCENAGSL